MKSLSEAGSNHSFLPPGSEGLGKVRLSVFSERCLLCLFINGGRAGDHTVVMKTNSGGSGYHF